MKRLVVLFLIACGAAQPAPTEIASTEAEVAVDPLAIPPGAADIEVELVSAGTAGDAQPLRLHPVQGQSVKLAMTMQMSLQMSIGENDAPPVEAPLTHMLFAMRVSHVNDVGLTRRELLLEELRVDAGPNSELVQAELAPLEGMTGYAIVDARGRMLVSQYDIPSGVSPATQENITRMQEMMQQVQPPFPEEPVSVGARWRVTSRLNNEVVMDQIQDFELVERDGESIVLRVVMTQSAEPQPMDVPQPGVTGRLLSLQGEANASIRIQLDSLETSAEFRGRIHVESELMAEGQTVPMRMTTQLRTQTTPH